LGGKIRKQKRRKKPTEKNRKQKFMKLEITSPLSRQIAPTCGQTEPRTTAFLSVLNPQPSSAFRHRAIIRSRRRRRGFGGPLQLIPGAEVLACA
jgi:hypothetical protein